MLGQPQQQQQAATFGTGGFGTFPMGGTTGQSSSFGGPQPPSGGNPFGTSATGNFGSAFKTTSGPSTFGNVGQSAPFSGAAPTASSSFASGGGLFGSSVQTTQPSTTTFGGSAGQMPTFGASTQTTGMPTFGASTQTTGMPTFGASTQATGTTSFGSASQQPVTASAFNAPAQPAMPSMFGSASGGFGSTGVPGGGFGATSTTTPPTTLTFNQSTQQPSGGLFGAQTSTTTATSAAPAAATAAPSFSGFSTTAVPSFGSGMPTTATTTAATAATQPTSGGISFGSKPTTDNTTVTTAPATSGFTFGAAPSTSTKPLFGAAPSAPEAPKTSGFTFSGGATTSAAPVATTGTPTTKIETKPTFSFGAAVTAPAPATTSTDAKPSVTFKLPEATKPPESTTTTATETKPTIAPIPPTNLPSSVSFPSNLKNKTLEEIINCWNDELETLVSSFEKQAVEVAQWDKKIVHNGEQIIALNDRVTKLETFQKEIDQSLSYVVAQQSELEGLLDGIDKELPGLVQAATGGKQSALDIEREHMYESTENVQRQVIDVANQLSRMIYEINTAATEPTVVPGTEGEGQPLVEIAQVLNAHLDALQWIDHKVEELKNASVSVKSQASRATSEMERFSNSSAL